MDTSTQDRSRPPTQRAGRRRPAAWGRTGLGRTGTLTREEWLTGWFMLNTGVTEQTAAMVAARLVARHAAEWDARERRTPAGWEDWLSDRAYGHPVASRV